MVKIKMLKWYCEDCEIYYERFLPRCPICNNTTWDIIEQIKVDKFVKKNADRKWKCGEYDEE